jgi:hypothetical protein
MTNQTKYQQALWTATLAVRQVLAQSKNPSTMLGQATPTAIAWHAAYAAVTAYEQTMTMTLPGNGSCESRKVDDSDAT